MHITWWTFHFINWIIITKMKANQKTVIHDSLGFQELTVSIKLPEHKPLQKINSLRTAWKMLKVKKNGQLGKVLYHLSSWNQDCSRRKTKFRSRSLRVVVSSISLRGLSVVRPWEEPLRSNLLWIRYSEQNTLPITINRVCFFHSIASFHYILTRIRMVKIALLAAELKFQIIPFGLQQVWHNAHPGMLLPKSSCTDKHVGSNLEAFWWAPDRETT